MRRKLALTALLAAAWAGRLFAQGGPPMITDDPGTPGPDKWEINVAWTDQRTPGETLFGAPLLDANYGIGDRIELTYYGSWNIARRPGEPDAGGMSDSELSAKWRFYDGGDDGLQVSVYPTVGFLTPGSRSDRRGLADGDTTYYLPFEFERNTPWIDVDVEVGHTFSPTPGARGWSGGVCVGRNLTKRWELDAEIHVDADEGLGRAETVLNLGSRIELSGHVTLLLAVGRDLGNTLGPDVSLLTYTGLQFSF